MVGLCTDERNPSVFRLSGDSLALNNSDKKPLVGVMTLVAIGDRSTVERASAAYQSKNLERKTMAATEEQWSPVQVDVSN
ncbi:hypothetical protein GWI33_002141 [Rhynchophorus ferrugineus]|uniref:Uncharacterized protein n=1 Tax=Rhynchophorus ferrugineus TaxID=354439 RepID=A0A834HPQ5_RHYFE|nr:hypothetical protein GWI33_002142 [Rhynchophorus ferrugineus]KAF7263512.1 hypothetical protein GWI33_002141 [Rhynchophorus ferrugineus]